MQASPDTTMGRLRAGGWRLASILRDTPTASKTTRAQNLVETLNSQVIEVMVLETSTLAFVWRRG